VVVAAIVLDGDTERLSDHDVNVPWPATVGYVNGMIIKIKGKKVPHLEGKLYLGQRMFRGSRGRKGRHEILGVNPCDDSVSLFVANLAIVGMALPKLLILYFAHSTKPQALGGQ